MIGDELGSHYMSGFGNEFATEALVGALPIGQNSPQTCPYGLYAEQISGTAFTAPRHSNARTWCYRIRPSVCHMADFSPIDYPLWQTPPTAFVNLNPQALSPQALRWSPLDMPSEAVTFLSGMRTLTMAGDVHLQIGLSTHIYLINSPMADHVFMNGEAEMLFIAEVGALSFDTEMGRLDIESGEIAVIPRGIKFKVNATNGTARGYMCENFGQRFRLPELGPIGANGLANVRDFLCPIAAFEDKETPHKLTLKYGGAFYEARLDQSPLDVVAWHGNYAPYKYDLRRFSPVGSVLFDHPDPSIFTVLTSPSGEAGVANVDFVIFPERFMVAEHSFRPPWYHRNIMSEFMGLIYGHYDAKETGFVPGGFSLHNMFLAHGPDCAAYDKAVSAELKPQKLETTLAFMLESRLSQHVSDFAAQNPARQSDYRSSWSGLKKHFTGRK